MIPKGKRGQAAFPSIGIHGSGIFYHAMAEAKVAGNISPGMESYQKSASENN